MILRLSGLVLTLVLLNLSFLKASEQKSPSELECNGVGKLLGSKLSHQDARVNVCYRLAYAKAVESKRLFAKSADGSVNVFGYSNIIFMQKGGEVSLIAGDMTKLNQIEAVAISFDGQTIVVLDRFYDLQNHEKKQLLYYRSSKNGNVAPLAVNTDEIISLAQNVTFDNKNDEILLPVVKKDLSGNIV